MSGSLLALMERHPGDSPALKYRQTATAPLVTVSYRQLQQLALAKRRQAANLQQQAVNIRYRDIADFICSLLAYDGFCSALYLLPDHNVAPAGMLFIASETMTDQRLPVDSRWYLATSGTTGTPKWIGHSLQQLTKTVSTRASGNTLCWGLVYQPFRFAGLQVVLQSLISGACLIDASDGDIEQRFDTLVEGNVTALSATPSLWRQFLFSGKATALQLQQLTLGGEIADQPLLNRLSQLYPTAQLRHIYASTEAGVAFAVNDGKAGFPRDYLEQGYYDLQFKVDAKHHLWLKNSALFGPELATRVDAAGFLDTEDLVELTPERVLFLGRASGVINVGGNKVHPEQVEQVVLQVPGVAACRVYGKSSSILGQLVMAELVAEPDTVPEELIGRVKAHCQQQLQRHQIPFKIQVVAALPLAGSGKQVRIV
ncbi:AMP-binding protein [Arsukibacterium indicum]|uniref:Long-chain-fatty-acid--CoA ligase n=1 Tax=Arsukibacterium indicum TaxID=2848612 RepID=A0ABS6MGD0_9GAMM|nr:AMP-binding protein [Arsukibacterium indicum]MBV2127872.1 AMP-binding protein [Arsukibacterium indicum]